MKLLFKKIISLFILYTKGGVSYARHKGVKVGSRCRIFTTNFGSEPFLIEIGNDVTITSGVKLITHDGSTWLMKDDKGRRYRFQKIEIGNKVFIGVNSIIMPGVKIDDNVIVAAGSVVTKSIPSGSIVAGVPAKMVGEYKTIEDRMIKNYISDQDMDYNKNYIDRILGVTNPGFKDYLKK
ncbi:DapH/DapD/GlmU-related protein [Lacinutrix sp. Bg11-31]|uniref:acyltransferase n=1 Tax=Lacinutrix sp. Bg11-31 TaxID=2057808 RepID=UPI000C313572|nr:acyltransferase [Lacinutrix sp. Bg11-31]AUC82948.1 acyltransferase [Lacinutrix sp. Bg11-31]